MNVLGINYKFDRSSVVAVHNKKVVSGKISTSRNFPDKLFNELFDPHVAFDVVVSTQKLNKIKGVETVQVDYSEALAMTSIASTSWDTCAVVLIDSCCVKLGYYANNSFYWLKSYSFENSLALFLASASKFLGFCPLSDQSSFYDYCETGSNIWESTIESNFIKYKDSDYLFKHDLQSGIGVGVRNADIATSAMTVYNKVVVSLVKWLNSKISSTNLAFAGSGSTSFSTVSAIKSLNLYKNISIPQVSSAAGTSLGACCLIDRALYDKIQIASDIVIPKVSPEQIAEQLLLGYTIENKSTLEFSDNPILNYNYLAIPFKANLQKYNDTCKLEKWQTPKLVTQEKDFYSYFIGSIAPKFGESIEIAKNNERHKVITTTLNRNPYINRVLEIIRQEGFPYLISSPIHV